MTRKGRVGPGCFVCLDKPPGPSSFDLVRDVRRVTGYRRAGHGGTLDPFASGLLVIAIGSATRLLRFCARADKRYRVTIRFGITTDTDDLTGSVCTEAAVDFPRAALERTLRAMVGPIQQRPPRVSAVKVAGRRAYALHRRGVPFAELPPRLVHIHRIDLVDFTPPTAQLVVECGGGTYIRSLARDVGALLGCGGHVTVLRRERVGALALEQSTTPSAFAAAWPVSGEHAPGVVPAQRALNGLPQVVLANDEAARVRCGEVPAALAGRIAAAAGAGEVAILQRTEPADRPVALPDVAGRLVAVATARGQAVRLAVVLAEQEHGDLSGDV